MAVIGRTFRERKDPFVEYQRESDFRQRYRLSKAAVAELSKEFGNSEWATRGTKKAKGLSHRERVRQLTNIIHKGGRIVGIQNVY